MIKFDILERFSSEVAFTAKIDCDESESHSVKVGLSVKWALKNDADLRSANLSDADLRNADLSDADLRNANLLACGNMAEIKTLQFDKWAIGYTHDTLQIGCQRHAIEKWAKWDSEAGRKWIAQMDEAALDWAEKYLALVLSLIEASPAVAPEEKAEAA